jgi:hypothetical protein
VSQDLVFSFESNEGTTPLTSVVVRIFCGFEWKFLILDLMCVPHFSP